MLKKILALLERMFLEEAPALEPKLAKSSLKGLQSEASAVSLENMHTRREMPTSITGTFLARGEALKVEPRNVDLHERIADSLINSKGGVDSIKR